jgi:uncharacterized protein (DUF1919 family)
MNKNFTIISNNCWGGGVYEDLGIRYFTPTVGLFFFAPCYIKFLKNLKTYLSYPIEFKNSSFYLNKDEITYPVGVLNEEVEIHFLHYKSTREASSKWEDRKTRVNFDNLFISFSDRDLCSLDLILEFDSLDYKNKVFFSAKKIPNIECLIHLKKYEKQENIGDIYSERWNYRKAFNIVKWLN